MHVGHQNDVSRVWILYRSHFHWHPTRDLSRKVHERDRSKPVVAVAARVPTLISSGPSLKCWGQVVERIDDPLVDVGSGCILQSGQSWISTALIHLHLDQGAWRFSILISCPNLTIDWRLSPSRVLCNLRPNFDVVLRFGHRINLARKRNLGAMSTAAGANECVCCYRCLLKADTSQDRWCNTSQTYLSASRSRLMARSSGQIDACHQRSQ